MEKQGSLAGSWWWVAISGDPQSYYPFKAAKEDTRASVQQRVIEYYTNRLVRLAEPTVRGAHWSNRNSASKAAAAKNESASA